MRILKTEKRTEYEKAIMGYERSTRWLTALVLLLLIYLSIPVARASTDYLISHTPFEFLANLIYTVIAYFFIAIFFWKIGLQSFLSFSIIVINLLVFSFFVYTTEFPAEKIHLVEYAVLGFLFFRALALDLPAAGSFAAAFLLVVCAGLLDETIQHFTPGRVGDIFDVLMDVLGGVSGLVFTAVAVREKRRRTPAR